MQPKTYLYCTRDLQLRDIKTMNRSERSNSAIIKKADPIIKIILALLVSELQILREGRIMRVTEHWMQQGGYEDKFCFDLVWFGFMAYQPL